MSSRTSVCTCVCRRMFCVIMLIIESSYLSSTFTLIGCYFIQKLTWNYLKLTRKARNLVQLLIKIKSKHFFAVQLSCPLLYEVFVFFIFVRFFPFMFYIISYFQYSLCMPERVPMHWKPNLRKASTFKSENSVLNGWSRYRMSIQDCDFL